LGARLSRTAELAAGVAGFGGWWLARAGHQPGLADTVAGVAGWLLRAMACLVGAAVDGGRRHLRAGLAAIGQCPRRLARLCRSVGGDAVCLRGAGAAALARVRRLRTAAAPAAAGGVAAGDQAGRDGV